MPALGTHEFVLWILLFASHVFIRHFVFYNFVVCVCLCVWGVQGFQSRLRAVVRGSPDKRFYPGDDDARHEGQRFIRLTPEHHWNSAGEMGADKGSERQAEK